MTIPRIVAVIIHWTVFNRLVIQPGTFCTESQIGMYFRVQ